MSYQHAFETNSGAMKKPALKKKKATSKQPKMKPENPNPLPTTAEQQLWWDRGRKHERKLGYHPTPEEILEEKKKVQEHFEKKYEYAQSWRRMIELIAEELAKEDPDLEDLIDQCQDALSDKPQHLPDPWPDRSHDLLHARLRETARRDAELGERMYAERYHHHHKEPIPSWDTTWHVDPAPAPQAAGIMPEEIKEVVYPAKLGGKPVTFKVNMITEDGFKKVSDVVEVIEDEIADYKLA